MCCLYCLCCCSCVCCFVTGLLTAGVFLVGCAGGLFCVLFTSDWCCGLLVCGLFKLISFTYVLVVVMLALLFVCCGF